ncbi:MAG: hypothetical protein WEC75_11660 [Dehalococcoidia bacterium]
MSQIVIVSGPPGAGKSTVCDLLCERYDRTVHLLTDEAYGWIRMGFIEPWKPGSLTQNLTVSRAAARAATAFAQARYGVFVDGVIGPQHLPVYLEELQAGGVPVHYAVLLPSLDETKRRALNLEKQILGADDMFARVYAMFADQPASAGCTIDSTSLSAQQTADRVMDACGRGDCLVYTPP